MPFSALRVKSELRKCLPFGRALHREQAVAILRLAAAFSLVALFPFIRVQSGQYSSAVCLILCGYALASLIILARVFVVRSITPGFLFFVHLSDLFWPSLICFFTGCENSPLLFLFIFALLASPYRRRWFETLLVAFASIFIILFEAFLLSSPGLERLGLLQFPVQMGPFAVKSSILIVVAAFLSYSAFWTEREQQAYAVRSVLRRLRSDAGIEVNLREILPAVLDVFEAKRAVLVLRNASTSQVFQWSANRDSQAPHVRQSVPFADDEEYRSALPETIQSIACSRFGSFGRFLALDHRGCKIPASKTSLRPGSLLKEPFRSLLATNIQFGSEWSGQIFLVDAPCAAGWNSCLRLLQQVAEEVGPTTYNFHLWQHASEYASALERRRLARDLHDGVVQSLIATEVQLELLRRRSSQPDQPSLSPQNLLDAQNILRTEVVKLRQQIEQLRESACIRPFLPHLTEVIEAFRLDTGIVTRFSCDVAEDLMPNRVSTEVIHILEEALNNVRKHSGARMVDVRLTSREDGWEILVQDDGCGFDFSGRLSLSQLDAVKKGPKVIRERVHSANGELYLESYPNRGSRLNVRLAANS